MVCEKNIYRHHATNTVSSVCPHPDHGSTLSLSLSRSVTWWLVRAGEIFAGTQPTAALRNPACAASLCLSEEVHFVKMASGSWTPGAETKQCFMMSMTNNLIWFWGPVQCHCLISKSYRFSQKSSFL